MPSKTELQEVLSTFNFHGIDTEDAKSYNGHIITDCRFCGKEDHFYIRVTPSDNNDSGLGSCDCKVCGPVGNRYSFLHKLYQGCLQATKDSHYKRLSSHRRKKSNQSPGIPASAFKSQGLAWDSYTQRWIIPIHNSKGGIVNLKVYDPNLPKPRLYATSGCKQHLYNSKQLNERSLTKKDIIIVCEGEWDLAALNSLLSKLPNKHPLNLSKVALVATSASSKIPKYELPSFSGKEIWLLYDHDKAGKTGIDRVSKQLYALPKPPKMVAHLRWPESTPDNYDLSDLIGNSMQKSSALWEEIRDMVEEVPRPSKSTNTIRSTTSPSLKRTSFSQIINDFKETKVSMSPNMEDGLAISLAVILSCQSQGDPLWTFIVAPSGAGKSLLLESALESEQTIYRTSVGCKDFLSGYKSDGDDPSLLNQLVSPQSCLLIKDYTGIITLPYNELEQLYGIFRDAYDGKVTRSWGNGVMRDYNGFFSVIAGVTPKIHTLNHTALGERFLKFQLANRGNVNKSKTIMAAIAGGARSADDAQSRIYRQESVRAFIHHRTNTPSKVVILNSHKKKIACLAQFTSICRARVERDRDGSLSYEASPESGTRLAKQLTKMAHYLCQVFNLRKPNDRVMHLLSRLSWDTAYDRKRAVYTLLFNNQRDGIDRHLVHKKCDLPLTAAGRCLEDFRALGLAERRTNGNEGNAQGRPKHVYRLNKESRDIYRSCNF